MPQKLYTQDIDQYIANVNSGGVEQAKAVYGSLLDKGYQYAGWAGGVAAGNTITGQAALDYLQGTALMGLGGETCRNLTPTQIEKIKVEMALGYLNTLRANSDIAGGSINQDVSYKKLLGSDPQTLTPKPHATSAAAG